MCGIVCAFEINQSSKNLRPQVLEMSKKIRHRGPDWSGIYVSNRAILSHERLAIVDPISGKQPLYSENRSIVLAVNGEIYNHLNLRDQFKCTYNFRTNSDCEVLIPMYQKYGPNFVKKLNGIFAFAIYDKVKDEYFIARDHLGIIPLYMGWCRDRTFFISSELKALESYCTKIEIFPPGNYIHSKDGMLKRWYKKVWKPNNLKKKEDIKTDIRNSLESAVQRQLMTDVPYGVLLSGGLDSSIIASIVNRFSKKRVETDNSSNAWWPQVHSFSVGLKESPDLIAAKLVSKYLNTTHHEVIFTVQEGMDAIEDVIYKLETYDITTIRAATPMYLMARVIKSMGIKMVLSGEGADEIFGGYLYFHKAPNSIEFHDETIRKLNNLHLYDCLRANKSMAAWGVEARVPFLDKDFIEVAMMIDPELKLISNKKIEKSILRESFHGYLPNDILYRQKEQFSDGVGYDWIDSLKMIVDDEISDRKFIDSVKQFSINPPMNKEELFYRNIFNKYFPSDSAALTVPSIPSVACSSEVALKWDRSFKDLNDPSGRSIVSVHNN